MAGAGEKADQAAAMESGRGDHEVVQMARAIPGIIGAVDIAFCHGLGRECLDEMAHRFRH